MHEGHTITCSANSCKANHYWSLYKACMGQGREGKGNRREGMGARLGGRSEGMGRGGECMCVYVSTSVCVCDLEGILFLSLSFPWSASLTAGKKKTSRAGNTQMGLYCENKKQRKCHYFLVRCRGW